MSEQVLGTLNMPPLNRTLYHANQVSQTLLLQYLEQFNIDLLRQGQYQLILEYLNTIPLGKFA